ncbi:MAG TPA: phosphoserine phosphatase SerB [Microthrixaceae bacterium]|nr:phosphoserine phosphatase SerB [Microthrixaceae bacterium]
MPDTQTILIRVSGPDRPGITSRLMDVLGELGATVDDVEQVVIRRHLTLGLIVRLPADASIDALRSFAEASFGRDSGLSIDVGPVDTTPTERALGVVVTVLAPDITPAHLGAVADTVAGCGGNIDRIVRLSRYPVFSYELTVLGAPIDELRTRLVVLAHDLAIDVAIQPDGLGRRSQRLVMLDVDSTLIQDEVIELLADEAGCGAEVRRITEAAMAGELDFEAALRARVGLLAGLDGAALERAGARVRLTPGARTFVRTLRRMGFRVAIVSGGFTAFTEPLRERLSIDHAFANELEVVDGIVTGELVGPVVDRKRKAELLAHVAEIENIPLDQTVAVGDGANDLDMLAAAGLGIAFNAKPVLREVADTAVNVPYLDAVLFVLGVRRSEIEAADAADAADDEAASADADGAADAANGDRAAEAANDASALPNEER